MSVTYTNRKGVTYHLCRRTTKAGKYRYVFAREPKGEPVTEIPGGWRISESVNGIVSLVKDRPARIRPGEIAAVERVLRQHPKARNYRINVLRQHPKARNYRINVRRDRIEVYEQAGPDAEEVIEGLREVGMATWDRMADKLREVLDAHVRFTPVLRFVLMDEEQRTYYAERISYSTDNWVGIGSMSQVGRLAKEWIPRLGSDALFEVF